MTRPGSGELAEGDTKDPMGRGPELCFVECGRTKEKVSGDVVLEAYGHTMAWVWEIDKA
jgi:hypothetical protein